MKNNRSNKIHVLAVSLMAAAIISTGPPPAFCVQHSDESAAQILSQISESGGTDRAAHENLRRFIAGRDILEPQESRLIENALNGLIESDIKNAEAQLSAAELCVKTGNFQKAYYHCEMAVMAAPYNFNAKRKLNEIKETMSRAQETQLKKEAPAPSPAEANLLPPAAENSSGSAAGALPEPETDGGEESGIALDDEDKLSSTIKNKLPVKTSQEIEKNARSVLSGEDYKKNACYYITKKEYTKAENAAAKALELEPADNEANYLMAYVKYKRKKNEEAFAYINLINPETLTDAKLLHDTGVLLVRLKKNEEAQAFFTNGIACDRSYLENYISLAVYYTQIKDYDSAIKYFKEAMSVSPDDLKLIYFYALSVNRAGKYEEFISLANRLLQIAPHSDYAKMIKRRLGLVPTDRLISYDNEKTLLNVAIDYFNAGEYARAETKLKEIIKINPKSFDANLYLAKSAKNRGKMLEYAYYLLRLESEKSNIAIELELARAFLGLGLNTLSREFYLKYVNANPGDAAVKIEYAWMLRERGALISARIMGESILRGAKTTEEADAANLALAEINDSGECDTEEAGFKSVGAQAAENLYNLCLTLHENEMYKAIEDICNILTANGVKIEPRVLEIYCVSLTSLKKYARAIDAYKLIIASDRSNYNAYVQLGKIYLKRNNFVRAEEYFRAANIFRPEDAEILMLLGDSCYYQKNIEDAEIAYSEAYERAPNPVIKEEIKLKLDKIKLKKRSR
ncbi:MAG TPA: tetratricopeptide repeat protein [Candidatus Wallbacteria bacterium]|nr:tetratricopeptide repeat protein [Candidatus Wallbacteria bacterium]